jgi:16S rRNA (guanine527-N7)-methyltransferase
LPKGRNTKAELDAARGTWQGEFRIEPSVTDPESAIIVAERVGRRRQR